MAFADEDVEPFGKFENFADCVRKMKRKGMSEEEALKACDRLQSQEKEKDSQDDANES